jgi:hypothetical protein
VTSACHVSGRSLRRQHDLTSTDEVFGKRKVSLTGAKNKIAQLDQTLARRAEAVELGMPQFADLVGRSITTVRTQT